MSRNRVLMTCAEFIVQFLPKRVPKDLVPHQFSVYALEYGIIYEGSNYDPMDQEYVRRKEAGSKIKENLYIKKHEIFINLEVSERS